jgi:hypothetical protein
METPAPKFGDHIGTDAAAPTFHQQSAITVLNKQRAAIAQRTGAAPLAALSSSVECGGDGGDAAHGRRRSAGLLPDAANVFGDALAQCERDWYFNKTILKALSAGTQTGRFLFSRRWALSA